MKVDVTQPMKLAGRVAVVTGAAGGIGRAIACSLARRGCHLALADVDDSGLSETKRQVGPAVVTSLHQVDVADRAAVAALPALVLAQHQRVDVLVNNAGVALGGNFEEIEEADFEWLFEINFWGVVRMTRAFLPVLRASNDARIVNLSSLFGLVAPAGQTAYCASKFAVRGFSNALRAELSDTSIGITVAHPGGVATSIAKNARVSAKQPADEVETHRKMANRMLRMPPEKAGEIIVHAAEYRQQRVLVGTDAKLGAALERLAPVLHGTLLNKLTPKRK